MGNITLNQMASEYILNMNEKDMKDLNDVKKCNELIKSLANTIEKKPLFQMLKPFFRKCRQHTI